jgi:hypothetical protein
VDASPPHGQGGGAHPFVYYPSLDWDDAALCSYPASTVIDRFINTNALLSNSNLRGDDTNKVYLPENIRLPGITIEKDLNSSQDIGNGAVRCRFPFSCLLIYKRGVKLRTVST